MLVLLTISIFNSSTGKTKHNKVKTASILGSKENEKEKFNKSRKEPTSVMAYELPLKPLTSTEKSA